MSTKTEKSHRAWVLLNAKDLRKERERLGLSRKTLGDALGVSPGAVQNWESGTGTPDEEMQGKILAVLSKGVEGMAPVKKSAKAEKKATKAPRAAKKSRGDRLVAVTTLVAAMINRGDLAKDGVSVTPETFAAAWEKAEGLLPK